MYYTFLRENQPRWPILIASEKGYPVIPQTTNSRTPAGGAMKPVDFHGLRRGQ